MVSFNIVNNVLQFYTPPLVLKSENRAISKKPVFNINLLDPYPAAYNMFYNDRFPYRSFFQDLYTEYKFVLFHESSVPDQVQIGRSGWFFYTQEEKKIYEGKFTVTPKDIYDVTKVLEHRTLLYRQQGCAFYVAFAPLKSEIYPEKMPPGFFRSPSGTVTDKLIESIKKNGKINFIVLKEPLIKAKSLGRLYQVTDNHWNTLGAFVVYTEIINRIRKDFPSIKPIARSEVEFEQFDRDGGNLTSILGISNIIKEHDIRPVIRNSRAKPGPPAGYKPPSGSPIVDEYEFVRIVEDSTLPRGLIIRDSFGFQIMPFLEENFSRSVYIFDSWRYNLHMEIIEKEKPDIVLYLIYEPHIFNLIGIYNK
jgi:hypothetical protein